MKTFVITFEDGDTIITGFNGGLDEAKDYYLNNIFDFGDTEEYPNDRPKRVVQVDIL